MERIETTPSVFGLSSAREGWGFAIGLLWIAVGIGAMAVPWVASVVGTFAVALFLLVAGASHLVTAAAADHVGETAASIALSVLGFLTGGWLLLQPAEGAVALTFVAGIWLLVTGVARIGVAVVSPRYGALVALSGGLSLLLGGLLLASWPSSGLWAIGLFLGVDFLMAGLKALFVD